MLKMGFCMSNITNKYIIGHNLHVPDVKIIQYGYDRNFSSWNFPYRNSPFWYLYWNDTPGAVIHCNDTTLPLTPNIIVLIPPHTTFSTENYQEFDQFYIHFNAGPPFDRLASEILVFPADCGIFFIPQLRNWFSDERLVKLRLYSVVYEMLLNIPHARFMDKSLKTIDPRIQKAVDLMSKNFVANPNNEVIARSIGMSVNNYIRRFRQEIGLSPQRYCMNRRLDKARNLLLNTENSIDEIAAKTAFANRYHFSKAFKNFFKISPSAFRKEHLLILYKAENLK
jgi:AraC-like DNA-binding protein